VYNGVAAALPNDRLLRDIVCLVMSYEINALMGEPSFVALLDSGGGSDGIAADAAKSLAQRVSPEQKRYLCPVCHTQFEAVMNVKKYSVSCFHCSHYQDVKDWAKHVVLPDLTALWREHQEKKNS
jgi:DNA-directed RNA polymerase subunit RPC12/RpoP